MFTSLVVRMVGVNQLWDELIRNPSYNRIWTSMIDTLEEQDQEISGWAQEKSSLRKLVHTHREESSRMKSQRDDLNSRNALLGGHLQKAQERITQLEQQLLTLKAKVHSLESENSELKQQTLPHLGEDPHIEKRFRELEEKLLTLVESVLSQKEAPAPPVVPSQENEGTLLPGLVERKCFRCKKVIMGKPQIRIICDECKSKK